MSRARGAAGGRSKAANRERSGFFAEPRVAETRVVAIEELTPRYADPSDNPNKMEPERFDLLCAAVKQEGFLQPILVTVKGSHEYLVEDGHHRLLAAQAAGLTQVSVTIIDSEQFPAAGVSSQGVMLYGQRQRLLGLGMNRLRGELDLRVASDIIREVQDALSLAMPDVSILTGFTEEELMDLLKEEEDLDLGDDAGTVGEKTLPEDALVFMLELQFSDRDAFKLAKKRLKKLGSGNMTTGLMVALAEDE